MNQQSGTGEANLDHREDINGYYLEELAVGMSAVFAKTITESDIVLFSGVTGDMNPVHVNEEYAKNTMFKGRIAHGMLTGSLISTVLGMKMPGPGCIYVSQELKFLPRSGSGIPQRRGPRSSKSFLKRNAW